MRFTSAFLLLLVASLAHADDAGLVVSAQWLAPRLTSSKLVIVHIADSRETFEAGHIPDSLFLPANKILQTRARLPVEVPPMPELQTTLEDLGIGNRKRIIIVSDDPLLSGRFYFTLDLAGHGKRAAILDGGIAAWKRERRPLATGAPRAPRRSRFTLRLNPEKIVFLSEMKALVPPHSVTIVDARPEDEYSGRTPGESIERPGHIPGAVSIPWTTNLTADGMLRPVAELAQLYEKAGVKRGWRVIVYCRTGRQASFGYFALRYLGYDVSLYDGSYVEWSNDAVTAVETD